MAAKEAASDAGGHYSSVSRLARAPLKCRRRGHRRLRRASVRDVLDYGNHLNTAPPGHRLHDNLASWDTADGSAYSH